MTGSPAMFLPRISGSAMFWSSNAWLPISSRQADRLALGVGQLDADHAAARDGRDARRQRRHVAGDVVGELDHPAGLDPARRLELVHRDHRARADLDDVAADVEILEHGFEQPRVALEPGAVDLLACLSRAARGEQVERRQLVIVAEREARLGAPALRARRRGRPARPASAGSATATAGRDRGGAAAVGALVAHFGRARRGAALARVAAEQAASQPFSSGVRPSAK